MQSRLHTRVLAFIAASLLSTASMASGLSTYNEDFDGLDIAGSEIGSGWIFFNNVFEEEFFLFNYSGAAPNGPQISALVDDQRDPDTQQLSIYSDYNCCAPDSGHQSELGAVETNVFREQTVLACNIGQTWTFSFDAKRGNLEGGSIATAFLKVIDPNTGFSTTFEVTEDMTAIPTEDWTSYTLEVPVGDWDGQLLQFGFKTLASNFEASGVFYDNVSFDGAGAGICPFSDDFESYNDTVGTVLGDAGYLVFASVSDPVDGFLFGYGPFPAPNQTGGFSGVSVGEGGPDQGNQQLNTFSDYNNVTSHTNGELIESIVYREQTVGAANVGETWTFTFDAKLGNLVAPTTAKAFIKTIDPANGFATTNEIAQDTTSTPATWQGYTLSLTIDAGLVGQLIQIGFSNTATSFNPSGVFYDNINFDLGAEIDTDGDGVGDSMDNCTLVVNAAQRDTNGDGFGNACDPDLDNNGVVNFADIGAWVPFFNTACGDVDQDFDGSGSCNFADYSLFPQYFLMPPGPSGVAP